MIAYLVFGITFCSLLTEKHTTKSVLLQSQMEIQRKYNDANVAATNKDVDTLFENCDPSFYGVLSTGERVYLPEVKISTRNLFAHALSVKTSSIITKFSVAGNIAEVTVKESAVILLSKPAGKLNLFNCNEVDLDTWIKEKSGWKEKTAKVITINHSLERKVDVVEDALMSTSE